MAENEYGTIIGADAVFKGDLSFDTAAKVLGTFEGSISSKGKVHIADGSNCKAAVTAKEVAIEGHIEGNVEATERVDLKPKGQITGDIVAAKMSMADGASIIGHCRIGTNGQVSSGKGKSATEVKGASAPASATTKAAAAPAATTTAAATAK